MSDGFKLQKIKNIIQSEALDGLLVGNPYNVRYVSGAWIPMTHAQPDRPIFAIMRSNGEQDLIVPAAWEQAARECAHVPTIRTIGIESGHMAAAIQVILTSLHGLKRIGIDGDTMPFVVAAELSEALRQARFEIIECGDAVRQARMTKTPQERERLEDIALKTDHAINGYFHHLIANRASSALVISEQLRIHSLERDIELSGYNACARAKVGDGTKKFWPYAPNYDFAAMDVRKYPKDTIIAEVANTDGGYWSNAIRMAVNAKSMSEVQDAAYADLNRLRTAMLEMITPGRLCAEIYNDLVGFALAEGIPIRQDLALGFGIGVAAMEAPYITSGDNTPIEQDMVLVLDLVVQVDDVLYRSRDTITVDVEGARIVNWYKDWREPYLAIGFLADFAM